MSTTEDMLAEAVALFREKYGSDPTVAAFAPGRANLIGEHTDYNDGFVLPFALPYKTIIVAAKSNDDETRICSTLMPDAPVTFKIDKDLSKGKPSWANYVKGTIYQYIEDLPKGCAFNAVIVSNVPLGSGLSSSAALEVSTATLLEGLYDLKVDGVKKALRCQKAEHTFAGTPCGIMDQYISTMGQEGNLLLIDCRSNGFTLVPSGKGDDVPLILITNSNVKHDLSGSEYPDRVKQCKQAVEVIKKRYPAVIALRDANEEMLESVKGEMSELAYRRARHVIGENARTLSAVDALKKKNYRNLGLLMTQSHMSLRDDYEVSCEELDALVDLALQVPGVYGSRMTGGGFGGCTVTLVDKAAMKPLEQFLAENYFKKYNTQCTCYEAIPSAGAGLLDLCNVLKGDSSSEVSDRSPWIDYVVPIAVVALSVVIGVSFAALRRKV